MTKTFYAGVYRNLGSQSTYPTSPCKLSDSVTLLSRSVNFCKISRFFVHLSSAIVEVAIFLWNSGLLHMKATVVLNIVHQKLQFYGYQGASARDSNNHASKNKTVNNGSRAGIREPARWNFRMHSLQTVEVEPFSDPTHPNSIENRWKC